MGLLDVFMGKKKSEPQTASGILPVLPAEIYKAAKLEFRDIIAPSALEIAPKSINLGDKIARTFFVISYPRFLTDNWFSPIINLDRIFDVSIFIHPIETEKILSQFQKKVAEVQKRINKQYAKSCFKKK
jgi:hypothetical protein